MRIELLQTRMKLYLSQSEKYRVHSSNNYFLTSLSPVFLLVPAFPKDEPPPTSNQLGTQPNSYQESRQHKV